MCLVTVLSARPGRRRPLEKEDGMSSMTSPGGSVTGGVDAHTDTHDAAALDERGRLLGTQTFSTTGSPGPW